MKTITIDEDVYRVLSWEEPKDTNYEPGDICIGVYAAKYGDGPYFIVARGDKTFQPLEFSFKDENPQPLYVMNVPGLLEHGLLKIISNEAH